MQDTTTNRQLKIVFEVIDNVGEKYPEAKDYIEKNMEEICERGHITVEEAIYFVIFA